MDAIECLKTRRSIRVYRSDAVPEPLIRDVVDCGRLAATAMNAQPWTFVVVREPERRARIARLVGHSEFLATAPAVIAVFCTAGDFTLEDGCAATQNLLNAAWAHGLGSCWIAGERTGYAASIAEELGAPPGVRLVSLATLGWPSEEPQPDKRPLEEVLRFERF